MVLFLLIVLIFSSLGLFGLLFAKHWELTTGRVLLGSMRPQINTFFHNALMVLERHVPLLLQDFLKRSVDWTKWALTIGIARTILSTELFLEKILHNLRNATSPHGVPGEVSAFLREVAEHKHKLASHLNAPKKVR